MAMFQWQVLQFIQQYSRIDCQGIFDGGSLSHDRHGHTAKMGILAPICMIPHRLKGVSMVMGAATLTPLAYELEQAGEEGRVEDVPGLFAPIQKTFDQVSEFLSQDNWIDMAKQLDSCQV